MPTQKKSGETDGGPILRSLFSYSAPGTRKASKPPKPADTKEKQLVAALRRRAAALSDLESRIVAVSDIERGLDAEHPGWRDPMSSAACAPKPPGNPAGRTTRRNL